MGPKDTQREEAKSVNIESVCQTSFILPNSGVHTLMASLTLIYSYQ